ncbi:hypothetical protein DFH09DRAFT_932381, partial [Mycena vulgaris]
YEFDGLAARVFDALEPSTVPLYHLYHPGTQNNFYTRDARERDVTRAKDAAYEDRGIAAYVFERRVCGAKPLFRVHNPTIGTHFYTTDVGERDDKLRNDGYVDMVITGFVIKE